MAGQNSAELNNQALDTLVLQKEQEWREALNLRVENLEKQLCDKDNKLKKEQLRFRKLKEDFEYNLSLIEERDNELEQYEAVFVKVKESESVKVGEVSELLVKIDEIKLRLENEVQAKDKLQKHYQNRLKEYQHEMNNFRQTKENEMNKEREELSCHRRNLESQLRAAEDDYEFRRQELVSNFDEMMRKREQEYQSKLDETNSVLLASELKIRTLVKELELVCSATGRCKQELEERTGKSNELEKELKENEWLLKDMENMHNFKIADLQTELDNMKSLHSKVKADFTKKHNEQDRLVKEQQDMLLNAKQGFAEQERKLLEQSRHLHSQLEQRDQQHRQNEWRFTDQLKEYEIKCQRLHEQIEDLKGKLESETREMAENIVAKDVELETLHQQEGKLRSELAQRKDELARRQKELTVSLERESALERSKAQMELDWQRRCEDSERSGYEKQEELVRSLTEGKEQATALINKQKRELLHKDSVVRILTEQRDQAVATLNRHGLSVPQQLPTKEDTSQVVFRSDASTVEDLQTQNNNLLEIIHQMRNDMENFTVHQTAKEEATLDSKDAPVTPAYVSSLEKEVRELKSKNRALMQTSSEKKPPLTKITAAPEPTSSQPNEYYVMGHVKELNDTIGALRQEKLELTSELRKCEATVVHLQGIMVQATEECRQKQSIIDKLKYEVSSVSRRTQDEVTSLKQRNSDLSLQLSQARHEAEEFYKNSVERNIDAVSLGNQLSALKIDLASQGNSSYNPQSYVIRQLQHELQTLRNQRNQELVCEHSVDRSSKLVLLQNKLRDAAKRINVLVKEKEQLIKIGNKLRAELMKITGHTNSSTPRENLKPPPVEQPSTFQAQQPPVRQSLKEQQSSSKLQAVEQLQYQLTARELQYAKRGVLGSSAQPDDVIPVTEEPPSRDQVSPWQPSFSSDEHSSLKEVWKLLDDDTPVFTPRDLVTEPVASSSGGFTVKGRHSNLQVKPAVHKQPLSKKTAGKWKPAIQPKAKIRNYNVKDHQT